MAEPELLAGLDAETFDEMVRKGAGKSDPITLIASGSMKNTGISIEHIFHLVQDTVARHIQQLSADARVLFQ